jgi:formylglycine-generating enzyme required for sulfatase activity
MRNTRLILLFFLFAACQKRERLHVVTVAEFRSFVDSTGYVSDSERYGESNRVITPHKYIAEKGLTWKNAEAYDLPVVCVSLNDARAYARWAGARLPTEKEYWLLAARENRLMNISTAALLPTDWCATKGNAWDWTEEGKTIGGSYLCEQNTCAGWKKRGAELQSPDPSTTNTNLGIAIIVK